MADPERLLSATSDLDWLERELLVSVRHLAPPERAKADAWIGISAKLAPAALVAAAHGSAAAAAPTSIAASSKLVLGTVWANTSVVKVAVGLALSAAAIGGGSRWMHEPATAKIVASRQPPLAASIPAAARANVQPRALELEPCSSSGGGQPCPNTVDKVPPPLPHESATKASDARQRDLLAAESRLLSRARTQLRHGHPEGALTTLERLEARFRNGELVQEREVLTIEVLEALGDTAGAHRRARSFVEQYPASLHSAKLRRFLERP
jgi:hypothetical protein